MFSAACSVSLGVLPATVAAVNSLVHAVEFDAVELRHDAVSGSDPRRKACGRIDQRVDVRKIGCQCVGARRIARIRSQRPNAVHERRQRVDRSDRRHLVDGDHGGAGVGQQCRARTQCGHHGDGAVGARAGASARRDDVHLVAALAGILARDVEVAVAVAGHAAGQHRPRRRRQRCLTGRIQRDRRAVHGLLTTFHLPTEGERAGRHAGAAAGRNARSATRERQDDQSKTRNKNTMEKVAQG